VGPLNLSGKAPTAHPFTALPGSAARQGFFVCGRGGEGKSKHRQNAQGAFGQERKKQKNQDEKHSKHTRLRVYCKNRPERKNPLKNPKMA